MAASDLTRCITRVMGYGVFSAMFCYDVIGNNNDFGLENAGMFALVILGDTGIIKLAEVIRGRGSMGSEVSTGDSDRIGSERSDMDSADNKSVAKRQPRARQGSRGKRPY